MIEFRASRGSDTPALTGLWQRAFGDEKAFVRAFFEAGYAPERSRVAVIHGEIAAMLYWFDCALEERKLAYIYAVATEERFRGKGIASMLMEDTQRHLAVLGYDGTVLCPGSESLFRFYEKMGYVTAGFREETEIYAGAAIPIREVGTAEYARLRARLLPVNGIRQEGANLDFLHRFARFYVGERFAAVVSGDEPFCLEFLGDMEQAPGLLAALGCSRAVVRTPGERCASAMVKWISGADPVEALYLGFPFD